tara:strand:- start:1545 stop:2210 length:666 start_codon:yes stop_codon:yes gene_type:complete
MLIKNYKNTQCLFDCNLFNDDSNFLYWENRDVTDDEIEIVNYLNTNIDDKLPNILHIGIGNSYLAKNLKNYSLIDGISIANNEIRFAKKLNLPNYKCLFLNKLSSNALDVFKNEKYDYIIDVNLKSYSCCDKAFHKMFNDFTKILNENGSIISGKNGMKWSRILKPVYRFSLKNLIYKKLKEFDGPKSNILTISECSYLAEINGLKFNEINGTNIVKFSKI